MTFEEHWAIARMANPNIDSNPFLRPIAECAWNAGAKAEREDSLPAAEDAQGWRPMDTAPKDGTMLSLLVQFDDNAIEDSAEPCPTIGANTFDHSGVDEWKFAGWSWSHDCFTEGTGTPVGWLPMLHNRPAAEDARDGWISVEERLPYVDGGVLVAPRYGGEPFYVSAASVRKDHEESQWRRKETEYSHWRPLPAAPAMSQEPAAPTLLPPDSDPMVLELARDAARYRWLKDECIDESIFNTVRYLPSQANAAIDAAMSQDSKVRKDCTDWLPLSQDSKGEV